MNQQLPSKTFCILPWIHFFHSPSGTIQACCAANAESKDFGNIRDFATVEQLINSNGMRNIRADMLAGKENNACKSCYREEKLGLPSFRTNKNSDIDGIDVAQLVSNTEPDGHLHNFQMQYWDSRFSNICNLKCRMCGPEYSHTWAEESYRHLPVKPPLVIHANETDDWDSIINKYGDLSQLREVYFAGGEALFQSEHWSMLDHLVKLNKTDIRITYTTNLTKLSFGKHKIEDYLAKFSNVLFIVSLDATGPLVEYIRSGVKWPQLVDNIKFVQQFPGVRLKFNAVVTIYNILYLDQLIEFAYTATENFNKLDLSVAHGPETQNITTLPLELKDLAATRLRSSKHYSELSDKIEGVINYMYEPPVATWQQVMADTDRLDTLRNESVLDVVPEFAPFWK